MNISLYTDDVEVIWGGVVGNHNVEITTEEWNTYRTSLIDQTNFECLVAQNMWDKIKKIQMKTWVVDFFKETDEISDWLKGKLSDILGK